MYIISWILYMLFNFGKFDSIFCQTNNEWLLVAVSTFNWKESRQVKVWETYKWEIPPHSDNLSC